MWGRISLVAAAAKKMGQFCDHPVAIQYKIQKHSLDRDMNWMWLGG